MHAEDINNHRQLISSIMAKTGLTASALALRAGLSPSTILRVQNGESDWLKPSTVYKLMNTFNVVTTEQFVPLEYVKVYPLFGEHEDSTFILPSQVLEGNYSDRTQSLFFWRVRDDAMSPELSQGDLVLIDAAKDDTSLPGMFAFRESKSSCLIRLVQHLPGRAGWLRLSAVNSRYGWHDVEERGLDLLGRIVWKATMVR